MSSFLFSLLAVLIVISHDKVNASSMLEVTEIGLLSNEEFVV